MKKKLLWAVSLAAVVAPVVALGLRLRDDARAERWMREGMAKLDAPIDRAPTPESLDWHGAEALFDRVVRASSDGDRGRRARALWHSCRALGDLSRGELVLASAEVQTARREDPDELRVTFVDAVVLQRRGERRRAAALLDGITRGASVPASLRARVGLHRLDLLLDEGDGHAALALAESLAHGTTVRAALGNRLGLARSAVGDVAGARAAFEAAHQSDPRDASALINLARVARTSGDREGARRMLQQALALDETNGEAWLAYGVVLTDLGALVEARRAVLEAGRRMPDQAGPWTTQGEIDLREGHPTEAAASFREALQRAPDDTSARTNLGVALARTGDRQGALQAFEQVTQRAPSVGQAWNGLGVMRLGMSDPEGAIGPLEHASRLLPDDPNPPMNLGLAYERLQRWNEAARAFRETLRRAPTHELAASHLAAMQPADARDRSERARVTASR
ncbi:MAG: tetratricopeptide repeat protein [Deltaproteobacteria bacterium]|nr:tetratricopeptide repeat protein [Myxococcales bacterium]MDP3214736.1 tetratricopeptide repeat protein [Deltaproteobacteria bacterium]